MANYFANNCAWKINGEPLCKEGFIDIDSGGAELGQACDKEDCKNGTCFQPDDKTPEKCMYVLMPNEKGCNTKSFTTCTRGLTCVDDYCVFPNQKPPTPPKEPEKNTENPNDKFDKMVLYAFAASIFVLIIIMLIMLALGL